MAIKWEFTPSNIITIGVICVSLVGGYFTMNSALEQNKAAILVNAASISNIESDIRQVINPVNASLASHDVRLQRLEKFVAGAEIQFTNIRSSQERMEAKLDEVWDHLIRRDLKGDERR